MSSVGSYLRELRERRGVSLEEISRVTHVTRSYLDALERGEFGKLPAPVFVRGFIRAYCQVLREPADEALVLYENRPPEATGPPTEAAGRIASRDSTPRSTVVVSLGLLVVLGAALIAVTLALRSGREGGGTPRAGTADTSPPAATTPQAVPAPRPDSAPPPTSGTVPPASTSSEAGSGPGVPASGRPSTAARDERTATTSAPAAPQSTPPAAVPNVIRDTARLLASASSPYRLIARTSEATWVRVRTEDGRQLSEETIPAGQVREWVSNRRFDVTIGNAGGVRLELNGRPLPVLGASRDVVRLALPPEAP
jgi:cytoskeletal protein RodZ